MARFFADEEFPHPTILALRSFGHDVSSVSDVGKDNEGWPDVEVLLFAIADNRIVLTRNRGDFYRLHQRFPEHPGIIACTDSNEFQQTARQIEKALAERRDCRGQFIRIYRGSVE